MNAGYGLEEELVEFLVDCAKIGYVRTRSRVMETVQQCLMMRRLEITVTNGWWGVISPATPELKLRTGEKLAYSRTVSSTSKILDNYFDILESTFVENDLCDKPFQIYNVDESNIPLYPPAVKVVSLSGVIKAFTNSKHWQ